MSQVEAPAGVEFHSVAGESCCAGVQVFCVTPGCNLCSRTHVAVSRKQTAL